MSAILRADSSLSAARQPRFCAGLVSRYLLEASCSDARGERREES